MMMTTRAVGAPTRSQRHYATACVKFSKVHAVGCVAYLDGREAKQKAVKGRHHSSLIDRLGGPDAVKVAVDKFYVKVLADDRVKHYFDKTDMNKQRAHQAAFMTYAFGGPSMYKGKDMAEVHRKLDPHLNETHFNAIVENFVATLQEMGVDQHDIDEAVKVVASTKDEVLAE